MGAGWRRRPGSGRSTSGAPPRALGRHTRGHGTLAIGGLEFSTDGRILPLSPQQEGKIAAWDVPADRIHLALRRRFPLGPRQSHSVRTVGVQLRAGSGGWNGGGDRDQSLESALDAGKALGRLFTAFHSAPATASLPPRTDTIPFRIWDLETEQEALNTDLVGDWECPDIRSRR